MAQWWKDRSTFTGSQFRIHLKFNTFYLDESTWLTLVVGVLIYEEQSAVYTIQVVPTTRLASVALKLYNAETLLPTISTQKNSVKLFSTHKVESQGCFWGKFSKYYWVGSRSWVLGLYQFSYITLATFIKKVFREKLLWIKSVYLLDNRS